MQGAYAHGSIYQLYQWTEEVKEMEEKLTIQELSELVADAEYKKKHSEIARTTLKLVKAYSEACNQLTEKDATIGKLHERVSHYTAVRDNAVNHGYEQAMEIKRLRKALEEVRDTLAIGKYGAYEKAINITKSVLGEGDKNGN